MRDTLRRLAAEALDEKWGGEEFPNYDELRSKFVFHISDCMGDILRLAETYERIEETDAVALGEALHGFFLHAVPHLMAAGQIYDYIPMTFDEQRPIHISTDDQISEEE